MFAMFKISQCAHLLCQINIDIFFTVFYSVSHSDWLRNRKGKKEQKNGTGEGLMQVTSSFVQKKIIFSLLILSSLSAHVQAECK